MEKLRSFLKVSPWPYGKALASLFEGGLLEEENVPDQQLRGFYPMIMGEILNERYEVCSKLGHGSRCTVWLARDLDR